MTVWLLKQLGQPISYMLPAKTSFADMGTYVDGSKYFVYEADEYDRNFLAFEPFLSVITGIDWDHPDIYPTREDYNAAFNEFFEQSKHVVMWQGDADRVSLHPDTTAVILDDSSPDIDEKLTLPGLVNRQNAWLVTHAVHRFVDNRPIAELIEILNKFPGVSRRFEQIIPGLYSDYAHTPPKIRGALQLGHEVAGDNLVVVYEGLHNTRQHFIKDELVHLFDSVKHLYIVPSYLAREDQNLDMWSPADLKNIMSPETQNVATPAILDPTLQQAITSHLSAGDTVLCLTAGGGGSLDEWLRTTFQNS
jgi:UDP-N-acetylmuramate--alanine ligase